ncbi:hypothetical protein [Nocardia heshunensis]
MAKHAKRGRQPWRIAEPYRTRFRMVGVFALAAVSLLIPGYFGKVVVYFTGDRVTARVRDCWSTSYRGNSTFYCNGTWQLRDGAHGSGLLHGVTESYPAGAELAVRATPDIAITDSLRWPLDFGIGCAAFALLIWIAYRFVRRIRARRVNRSSNR